MDYKIKKMVLSGLMAALTAIGAFIYLPLPISPVPVTMQLFFAFLAGGLLGKKYGAISQIIYLLLGMVGLPVFAGGTGGIGILFGPTAGFLFAFPPVAYLAGLGANTLRKRYLYLTLGVIIMYIMGITGLMLITEITFNQALLTGALPFIPGDIVKISLAGYLINRIPASHPL